MEKLVVRIAVVLFLIPICIFFYQKIHEYFLKKENERIDHYQRLLEEQCKKLEKQYEISKNLKEELKTDMKTVAGMQLKKTDPKKEKSAEPERYCGNRTADFVFSQRQEICKKTGILMKIDLAGYKFEGMSDYDVSTLFCNLIDNAIEACRRCPENTRRYIEIHGEYQSEIFCITVKNPSPVSLVDWDKSKNPKTWKEDKENHGFGLSIIQETAKRNHGTCEIAHREGEFVVTLRFDHVKERENHDI